MTQAQQSLADQILAADDALRDALAQRWKLALLAQAEPDAPAPDKNDIENLLSRTLSMITKASAPKEVKHFPCLRGTPTPVVLVGGKGAMGRLLAEHFTASGYPVRILEKDDWGRAREILSGAGIVMVCAPMEITEDIIAKLGPLLDPQCLLTDITSVKTGPVKAMLAAHAGPVAGLHPMFGPDVPHFHKQVFVYVPGREPEKSAFLVRQIESWGARVVETTAEEHDRAMAIIQALRHFTTYCYGVFLARVHPDIGKLLDLSSPIYRLEIEMVGRLFAQDPALYGDIIMSSQANLDLLTEYVEGLKPELDLVLRRDHKEFVRRFLEARSYFGEWGPVFLRDSGKLLAQIKDAE